MLTSLCTAATTWAYGWLRREPRPGAASAFTLAGLALVYSNYVGLVFLGALGLHLLATRPTRREIVALSIAAASILA